MNVRPGEPGLARELIEMAADLSLRATGNSWHLQASNALWLLTRYGGWWGHLNAQDDEADLDRLEELSLAHQAWPVTEVDGEETSIRLVERRSFQELRLLIEQGGVIAIGGQTLHLRSSVDRGCAVCGLSLRIAKGTVTPVAHARRARIPWCVACAKALGQDLSTETGWAPTSEPGDT